MKLFMELKNIQSDVLNRFFYITEANEDLKSRVLVYL